MDGRTVADLVEALAAAGVRLWVAGGWAVDALVGEHTREHLDLDLADNFVGTFHDEGKTCMLACMLAYDEVGFDGVMRSDRRASMDVILPSSHHPW